MITENDATLIPREHTRRYGCENLHAIFFQHRKDRGGTVPTVAVTIPEARSSPRRAMRQARSLRARVMFVCDTGVQAKEIRDRAARLLPEHDEVSLARAEAGAWGPAH